MRVLVACEYSGRVRDAFLAKGHSAMSCDLLPTESPGPHHRGNVLKILNDGWDLMIAHPPCTYLTSAGQWYYKKQPDLVEDAACFFLALWKAPIKKICIENPPGYMCHKLRKADQYIDPYFFGEPYRKRTGLWLKNLPRLNGKFEVALNRKLYFPKPIYVGKKNYHITDALPGAGNGGHERSRTFKSIAQAMADAWG